jgi:MFS family permease
LVKSRDSAEKEQALTLKAHENLDSGPHGAASVRPSFIATYAIAYASLWVALLTPATITLALRVREIASTDATRSASLVLMAGAFVALVGNPVFGALSDRTRTRLGRRRPYLLVGSLAGLAALWLIGVSRSLGLVLFGWCLAQLAYNAVLAAMVAIVADRIPASQRGTVVGILGMCIPIGQIAGTFLVQRLATDLLLALLIPGGIGLVGAWMLAFSLPPDSPPLHFSDANPDSGARTGAADSERPETRPRTAASSPDARAGAIPGDDVAAVPAAAPRFGFDLSRHRDFAWAWSSRVLFVVGNVSFQTYQPFLLLDALGFAPADVPNFVFRSTLVQAATMMLCSLLAGHLSDRLGRRKPIAMLGSVLQGLGLWLIAVAHSPTTVLSGVALAGSGRGTYDGVNLALVTEVLPDRGRHAAKDLGLLNVANTLPQVIAPLAAPAILQTSGANYTLLFFLAGALTVLGAAFLLPIKSAR